MPFRSTRRPVTGPRRRPPATALLMLCSATALAAPAPPAASGEAPPWRYTVLPGDTLYSIAATQLAPGVGWQRLQRLNRVADPRRLDIGLQLRVPLTWLRSTAAVATVTFVSGRAYRQAGDAGAAGGDEALKLGDTLQAGDVLVTEGDTNVTLRLVDATRVLVAAGSRLRIDTLLTLGAAGVVRSRLELQRGETDTRVDPAPVPGSRYDLRTPVLTLGVRGTEFRVRVDADGQTTQAEVMQGRVEVTPASAPERSARRPPDARSLAAGFGLAGAVGSGLGEVLSLPPAPALAAGPARQERLPLRFAWPAQDGAVAYRAQVYRDSDAAPAAATGGGTAAPADLRQVRLLDGVFVAPAAAWPDLADGRYRLIVRARDARGLEGREAALPFVLKARPEPPFLRSPRDGEIAHGERVELNWTSSSAAQRYRLQVAGGDGDGGFDAPLLDRADLEGSTFATTLPPGRYRWRMASIAAGDDLGPFSDVSTLDLRPTPAAPALQPPQSQGDALVFRWRAGPPGERYDVQLGTDPEFAASLLERRVDAAELSLAPLPPGRYHLRVRSVADDGYAGPYGAPQSFEVARDPRWWLLLLPVVWLLL